MNGITVGQFSESLSGEAIVQGLQFFRVMAFALQTRIKPAFDLRLPRGIVQAESVANIFRQFQAIVRRQFIHGAFEFDNTHCRSMLDFNEKINSEGWIGCD